MIFSFDRYSEKTRDKYPVVKKKIIELIEAPIPKKSFSSNSKFFEIFPMKKTVSE
jgi:hypothetical protein|tara:strand:- start:2009 stop:2173 length:165 start_codon:yes stop_codon:yes gene_type:complete